MYAEQMGGPTRPTERSSWWVKVPPAAVSVRPYACTTGMLEGGRGGGEAERAGEGVEGSRRKQR